MSIIAADMGLEFNNFYLNPTPFASLLTNCCHFDFVEIVQPFYDGSFNTLNTALPSACKGKQMCRHLWIHNHAMVVTFRGISSVAVGD